ncbi:CBS domain-containing protein [Nitrospira sp. Ecomares 2.1]
MISVFIKIKMDVLAVLEAGRNVSQLTAQEIMVPDPIAIPISTTLAEAVKIMKDHTFLVLPVEENGLLIGCLTRQNLLQTWVDLGLEQKD